MEKDLNSHEVQREVISTYRMGDEGNSELLNDLSTVMGATASKWQLDPSSPDYHELLSKQITSKYVERLGGCCRSDCVLEQKVVIPSDNVGDAELQLACHNIATDDPEQTDARVTLCGMYHGIFEAVFEDHIARTSRDVHEAQDKLEQAATLQAEGSQTLADLI